MTDEEYRGKHFAPRVEPADATGDEEPPASEWHDDVWPTGEPGSLLDGGPRREGDPSLSDAAHKDAPEHPAGSGSSSRPSRRHRRRTHAFRTMVRRTITLNFARFMAVFGIVAIGAGVYAGLRMFVPDMYASADAFFDRYNLADVQVSSTAGLTDDDLVAIRESPGVRGAAGSQSFEMSVTRGEGDEAETFEIQVSAVQMDDYEEALEAADGLDGNQSAVSRPYLVEGRLPQAADEIAVSTAGDGYGGDIRVGDVLTVTSVVGANSVDEVLSGQTFTVVGLVQSPEWLSRSTSISPTSGASITNNAYIDLDATANPDTYTTISATVEAAYGQMAFTDAYDDAVRPVIDELKELAPEREQARFDDLLAQADDAASQASSAMEQASGAQDQAQAGIDAATQAQTQAREALNELSQYDEETLAALGLTEQRDAARQAFSQASDALLQAQDGREQATEAYAQASDAYQTAVSARDDLADQGVQHWYVVGRDASPSCYLYKSTALRMERICLIFPVFFFLVAALVCLTTISRMVETDRVEIGTLKALGYGPGRIAWKYLAFSGAASIGGAVVGICAGVFTLPIAIWTPYSRMYIDFPYLMGFHQPDCLIALGVSVGLALLTTLVAVRRTLRESAASLLLPPAPKGGRRIMLEHVKPLWRRLSFSQKVTARNVFRYKKRMVMTIVGVAGCTGLVLTGFGIQNKLDGFVQAQYGGIYTYDVMVNFDADAGVATSDSPLTQALNDELGPEMAGAEGQGTSDADGAWSYFVKQAAIAENPGGDPSRIPFGIGGRLDQTGGSVQAEMRDGRSDRASEEGSGILRDVTVYVPQHTGQDLILIDDYQSGARLELPQEGAVITERLAEQLMVGVGDSIGLSFSADDEPVSVRVTGIMRNLVGHGVYMSPQAYEAAFGEAPTYNMALGHNVRATAQDELVSTLAESDPAVQSVSVPADESGRYEDIAKSLNSIVLIILVVSGLLAFIVVYALTEINIEERRREIATLKVLGFTKREVRGYVYRETYLLVAIGILCGLPFGMWLCTFVMRAAEFDNVIFFRTLDPACYLFAAVLTALFAYVVTLAMRRRLASIDMASSLKSVE